eukprot:13304675-Alexandrium_andersonii.AAC.1
MAGGGQADKASTPFPRDVRTLVVKIRTRNTPRIQHASHSHIRIRNVCSELLAHSQPHSRSQHATRS